MSGLTNAERRAQQQFSGGILVAIGGLMIFLCGSCTAYFLGSALQQLYRAHLTVPPEPSYRVGLAQTVAIVSIVVGGLPTTLGVVLLAIGVRTLRRARAPDRPSAPTEAGR